MARTRPPRGAGALAVASALLLAACGTSGTSSGSPAGPASITGATPSGYVVHGANGFSVAVPSGMTGAPVTAGDGSVLTVLMPATGNGVRVQTEYNAHPLQSLDQRVASAHAFVTGTSFIHNVKDAARSVTVAGARDARLVSETFTNAAGPGRSDELLVLTRAGAFVDVAASISDRYRASLDVDAVIASFRLTG